MSLNDLFSGLNNSIERGLVKKNKEKLKIESRKK